MRILITLTSVLALVITFSAAAMADFSADIVNTSPHGSSKGKIYSDGKNGYSGKLTKMEMTAQGHTSITIMDQSKQVIYIIMPEEKMYIKQKYELNDPKQPKSTINQPAKKTFIRNDKFDGHPVKVYKAVADNNKETIIWEATDLNNFPVKIEFPEEKAVTEYRNISTKPLPKGVFEVPAGYKEMDMSGMIGGFGR